MLGENAGFIPHKALPSWCCAFNPYQSLPSFDAPYLTADLLPPWGPPDPANSPPLLSFFEAVVEDMMETCHGWFEILLLPHSPDCPRWSSSRVHAVIDSCLGLSIVLSCPTFDHLGVMPLFFISIHILSAYNIL